MSKVLSEVYPAGVSRILIHTKVSFVGIKASRKAVHVASGIGTSATASDSGEANEDGCLLLFRRQEGSSGDIRPVTIGCEYTMGAGTTGMDSALGNLFSSVVSALDTPLAIVREANILAHDQTVESSGGK